MLKTELQQTKNHQPRPSLLDNSQHHTGALWILPHQHPVSVYYLRRLRDFRLLRNVYSCTRASWWGTSPPGLGTAPWGQTAHPAERTMWAEPGRQFPTIPPQILFFSSSAPQRVYLRTFSSMLFFSLKLKTVGILDLHNNTCIALITLLLLSAE